MRDVVLLVGKFRAYFAVVYFQRMTFKDTSGQRTFHHFSIFLIVEDTEYAAETAG